MRSSRRLADFDIRPDAGVTLKPISVAGTRRIVRFAFEYSKANHRRTITLGHKAGIMPTSDGLFLRTAREDTIDRGDVEFEDMQIDHLTARLVREPGRFDVLLLPNLYGDIISDLCAGLVGGLGLIPGANIGWEYAVFEPVHGSAPDIAGKGVANPIAMILSGAMMLRHLGELEGASAVERAVDTTLEAGKRGPRTSAVPRRRWTWRRRSRPRWRPSRSESMDPDRDPVGVVSSRVRRGARNTPCSSTTSLGSAR